MAMRLDCSGCGGVVAADDAALRRRLAVCSQCNTIVRIAVDGRTSQPLTSLETSLPEGVFVERRGSRDLAISARRPRGAWTVNGITGFAGWSSGLAAAVAFTLMTGWTAAVLGIPVGVAAFVLAARIQRQHLPLELRGDLLLPSDRSRDPVAVGDLQQIYAAVSRFDLGGDSAFSSANVFALTRQGERVLLIGPVENEPVALAIEHTLTVELQLLEAMRMSDSARADLHTADLDSTPLLHRDISVRDCESCGARVTPSDAEAQRGIAECAQCRGLTLLYDLDAQMSALGAATPQRSYEIEEDVDGVSIVARDVHPGGGSVEVTGERIVLRKLGIAPMTLVASELDRVSVREAHSEADLDLDTGLARLRDATSMSGTIDLHKLELGGAHAVSFLVTARHPSRGEVELVASIRDPREAFLIARTLARALSKCA